MTLSLPAAAPGARSLTGVVPQLLAALSGTSDWFAPARSAIVFTVDGLGAHNLTARVGQARFLAAQRTKKDVARTVFPSTTASALTSLLTGAEPGEHGIVGYRARVPGTDTVVNQLKGWDEGAIDPGTWQRAEPLMAREAALGRPCFVVTRPEFASSGFTRATTRGAQMHTAASVSERAQLAADLAARHPSALVYVYTPDLDGAGHKHGWQSEQWSAALETVDGAVRDLARALPADVGAVVTADHGMVDVPRHRHLLLADGDPLLEGVRLVGGEPRMLHLYTEDGCAAAVHQAWTAAESGRSWILSRDEAIDSGLFGRVDAAVRARIGDVLVAARGGVAYYDDRVADKAGQKMIGQHGSLSPEETVVPLIRLGAFA